MKVNRRRFLKSTAAIAAGGVLVPEAYATTTKETVIYVVHGGDPALMLAAGIQRLGGFERFVKKGAKVTIKPNAAWASRPEQAGNTHPLLVKACIEACQKAGAKEVVLPENPCSPSEKSFALSGIGKAAKDTGARLYALGDTDYRSLEIPKGKQIRKVSVAKDLIETDCLINLPVAKSHGSTTITAAMKNWMGSVKDRRSWHDTNIHQCIADFSSAVKPNLIIIDATRIMATNGPQGPGRVETPKQLILGTDPVATDAYAATLFNKKPLDIRHIQIAHDMKIGCGDLKRVDVQHINI